MDAHNAFLQRRTNPSSEDQKLDTTSLGTNKSDTIDPVAESVLLKKLDWYLVPLFTLLYCIAVIDKTSIGNAKIVGIEKDLHLAGFDFNIALTVFFIFYLAAEVPSNLALKHFGSVWFSTSITAYGLISIGTAFVRSFAGLVVTRALLGIAEACTLCGPVYILSRYYRRTELVLRVGIFVGLAPGLGGAWRTVSLGIAYCIITTGIGLLCFLILPTDPQYTRMLNEEERKLVLARIDADQITETKGRREKASLSLVLRSFNLNTTLCAICFALLNVTFQGLSLFMPTVLTFPVGRFTVVESQLRTVPPYLLGSVWAIFCGYSSFRLNHRTGFVLISNVFMVIGYAIAIGTREPHARYAACFLSIAGATSAGPMVLAWATGNAAPDTVKAVTSALLPSIGGLGSIIAVWTYVPTDAPDYHNGNSLNLATSVLSGVIVLILFVYIRWENAKREQGERDYRLEGKNAKEIEELGYLHPGFRYQV
ncbi:MFS general substrate transporter [Marasmius fiardii PR-910]|nr:MFS general substrate transporter [Marasmius fiardii PR-910]